MLIVPMMQLWQARRLLAGDDPDSRQRREMLYGVGIAYVGYLVALVFTHADYPRFFWILLALTVAVGRTAVAGRAAHLTARPTPVADVEGDRDLTRLPVPCPMSRASRGRRFLRATGT